MKFQVHGPFDVPRANGLVDNSATSRKKFWASVCKGAPKLSEACGCYVFVIKARRGSLPWYVGRTTKRTFKDEALGAHQVNHYNQALGKKVGVAPQLFFVSKLTPSGRLAKPSGNSHKDIEFLETFLFGVALKRNPNLRNAKSTTFLKRLVVPGIINSPQRPPTAAECAMKVAFGL